MRKAATALASTLITLCLLFPGTGLSRGTEPGAGDFMVAQAGDTPGGRHDFSGWPVPIQGERNVFLELQALYLHPLGNLAKIAGPGGSLILSGSYRGLLLDNLVLGAEAGCLLLSPEVDNITLHLLVPLYLTVAYDIPLLWHLYIRPGAGMGYSYNVIFYEVYNGSTGNMKRQRDDAFEPILMSDLSFSYRGFESLTVFLAVRYYGVLEDDGVNHIMAIRAGAGIRL